MTTPTTHANVAAAFVAAQAQITHVVKKKTGQAQGATYRYADLADVIEMLRPVLKANGLAFQSINSPHESGALVRTRLIHESGETMESDGTLTPIIDTVRKDGTIITAGPQQAGAAYTYSRRYDLLAMFGIAADDDDGAAAMQAQAAKIEHAQRIADAPRLTDEQVACITAIMRKAGHTPNLAGKLAEDYATHVEAAVKYVVKQGAIADELAAGITAAAGALDTDTLTMLLDASEVAA